MAGRRFERRREWAPRAAVDDRPPRSPWTARLGPPLLGLALLCAWAPPLAAQGPLEALPGQNEAQEDVARALDRVCPVLDGEPGTDEGELQAVCSQLQATAGGDDGPPPPGVTEDINAALQSINGEELQTPESQLTEIRDTQLGNVLGRLEALRAGTAGSGLSIAGLTLEGGDVVLFADQRNTLRFGKGGELYPTGQSGDAVLVGQGGDLLGGFAGGRLGVFATGSFKFGDKDATGAAEGFDFYTAGVTAGADYRLTERLALGAAFGFSRFDADFDETTNSPEGQELESNSYLFSLFGTYYLDNGFFVDGIATVGYSDYESTRRVVIPGNVGPATDTEAEGDFDAWQYGVAGNVGYDTVVGPVRLTPRVQLEYLHADVDGFTEEGAGGLNLEFDDQDLDSLVIRPGVEVAYPISLDFGVISPYAWAEYVHEFLDNDDVEVRFAADPTNLSAFEITGEGEDENYGALGAGVTATLRGGLSLFAGYETFVGLDDFDVHRVSAGFRQEL